MLELLVLCSELSAWPPADDAAGDVASAESLRLCSKLLLILDGCELLELRKYPATQADWVKTTATKAYKLPRINHNDQAIQVTALKQ